LKKKILRILNRFNVGGPVYNATYLTKYLDNKSYETLLIGGKAEKHEASAKYILKNESINYKEIKYMKRSISIINDFISFFIVLKIIYRYKPDIIHTHATKAGLIGRFASFFYYKKIKLIHTYHGNVFEGYFNNFKNKLILIIERYLASKTTKIIAISRLQKYDLINKYLISKKDKIEVVPLGFDLNRFVNDQNEKRIKTRKKIKVKNEEVLITIIGRVVPIKDHRFFIDVFKYCMIKSDISLKAVVIGDGPELNSLINYTKKKDIKTNYKIIKNDYDIFFSSWRKDIDCFLAASDVVALTSLNEGTPVSIIESMASGTASISTDVGGVSDIIENGKSGIVIKKRSVENFGDNLLRLISNKRLRNKLAINGKKTSLAKFNYSVLIENMEKVYNKLYEK
tara:strand:+ start:25438 stop:26631 length:1194 start_codon:yes stop_codon:yes gene_type:complete